MGPEERPSGTPTRRDLRAAAQAALQATAEQASHASARVSAVHAASRSKQPAPGSLSTWSARLGILGALVAATVAVPLALQPSDAVSVAAITVPSPTGPSTVNALTGAASTMTTPGLLLTSAALDTRNRSEASRSEDRTSLVDCDGAPRTAGQNGHIPASDLCVLWDGVTRVRSDAAVALSAMNDAFHARFGRDLCLSSGYRSYAEQVSVKATRGGLAAAPGKSNHGFGLAVDFCGSETSGTAWTWIKKNGDVFGWENPSWALPGGGGPHEPWHWEYTVGTIQAGSYYE